MLETTIRKHFLNCNKDSCRWNSKYCPIMLYHGVHSLAGDLTLDTSIDTSKFTPENYEEKEKELKEEKERINHPSHYGGKNNPYEAIKIIKAHKLNFSLGNALKYILRCEHKGEKETDLGKAIRYLQLELEIVDSYREPIYKEFTKIEDKPKFTFHWKTGEEIRGEEIIKEIKEIKEKEYNENIDSIVKEIHKAANEVSGGKISLSEIPELIRELRSRLDLWTTDT